MPLPGNVSVITIHGAYVLPTGASATGSVSFTQTNFLRDPSANVVIVPAPVTVNLDVNGTFTVTLIATNDPDLDPSGWTYQVTESISSQSRTYSIIVPYDTVGTIEIADLAPTAPSGGISWSYVPYSEKGVAGGVASLDGTGKVPSAQLPTSSGAYNLIQDEGTSRTQRTTVNFIGAGVTAADDSANGRTNVTIPGGGGNYQTVQDEGSALTGRGAINFVGAGVAATDDSANNRTIVTIAGGGSSGGAVLEVNVKASPYNATGNGSTDDTTAIQSALNAGGITVFPPGTYLVGKLTIPHGAYLKGQNSGTYNNTFTTQVSKIKAKNALNDDLLSIPITSNRVIIEDLELDGNVANQTTGTGDGIRLEDDTVANDSQASIRRVYVHHFRGDGIYIGAFRQGSRITEVITSLCSQSGVALIGSDNVLKSPICDSNTVHGVYCAGSTNDIESGAISNNRVGINVVAGAKKVKVTGGNINKNLRQGIFVSGDCTVLGTSFSSNGRETNNTYDHVQTASTGVMRIGGLLFAALETGVTNQTRNALFFDAASTVVNMGGHTYESGSVSGLTNLGSKLYSSYDELPPGSVITRYENAGSYTRGTTRTDITVVFTGVSDPSSVALYGTGYGDKWDQLP